MAGTGPRGHFPVRRKQGNCLHSVQGPDSPLVPKIPSRSRVPVTSLPLSKPISVRILLKSPVEQVFIDQSGEGVTSLPFYGYSIVFIRLFNGRKKRGPLHLSRKSVASLPPHRYITFTQALHLSQETPFPPCLSMTSPCPLYSPVVTCKSFFELKSKEERRKHRRAKV